jgi:hypothetical protein
VVRASEGPRSLSFISFTVNPPQLLVLLYSLFSRTYFTQPFAFVQAAVQGFPLFTFQFHPPTQTSISTFPFSGYLHKRIVFKPAFSNFTHHVIPREGYAILRQSAVSCLENNGKSVPGI